MPPPAPPYWPALAAGRGLCGAGANSAGREAGAAPGGAGPRGAVWGCGAAASLRGKPTEGREGKHTGCSRPGGSGLAGAPRPGRPSQAVLSKAKRSGMFEPGRGGSVQQVRSVRDASGTSFTYCYISQRRSKSKLHQTTTTKGSAAFLC